ncbi:hypothetical protein [Polyangium spumosum]|uniref:Uncharacterized protein n=1 Tax=Polyangium spumosum TaxID=889282 RepID=A0A6N7Q1R7_9BACT|nr:hypothetical protein [Polyangium spumosum]MRG98223.1 hypothetical protein [Polyangium spumosum]
MIRISPGSTQIAVTTGSFTQPDVGDTASVSFDETKWRPAVGAILAGSPGVYKLIAAGQIETLMIRSVPPDDEVPSGTALCLAYYEGRKSPNSPPAIPPV